MRKGLRRLQAGGILLRELRGIRQALEEANRLKTLELAASGALQYRVQANPDQDPVTVMDVDTVLAEEMADLELRLTTVKGRPPTEEEILAAYEANHHEDDDPRRLSILEARGQAGGGRISG